MARIVPVLSRLAIPLLEPLGAVVSWSPALLPVAEDFLFLDDFGEDSSAHNVSIGRYLRLITQLLSPYLQVHS